MKKALCLLFIFGVIPAFAQDAAAPVSKEAAAAPSEVTAQTPAKQEVQQPAATPEASDQKAAQAAPEQKPTEAQAQTPAPANGPTAAEEKGAQQPQTPAEKPVAADTETKAEFVTARETVQEEDEEPGWVAQRVEYAPKTQRDPTLSPDDFLLLQYREQQRLAAIEAERQRKLAEERRKKEEAERLRQLELARIKDPTREVRNKIKIGGIIGQEVFIGSKIYTVGNTIYGARIVSVSPEEVVFSYKGHKFVRKVPL